MHPTHRFLLIVVVCITAGFQSVYGSSSTPDKFIGTVESHKGDWLELAPSGDTVAIPESKNWQKIFDGAILTSPAENSHIRIRFDNGEVLVRDGNVDAAKPIHESVIGGDTVWVKALSLLLNSRGNFENLAMARGIPLPLSNGVLCLTERHLDISPLFEGVPKGEFKLTFVRLDNAGVKTDETVEMQIARDSASEEEVASAQGFAPGLYRIQSKGSTQAAFAVIAQKKDWQLLQEKWNAFKKTLKAGDDANEILAPAYLCALSASLKK